MQTKVRRDKVMRALSVLEMAVSGGRPSRVRRKLIQRDAQIQALESELDILRRRLRHATNKPAPTAPETDAATLASDLEAAKNEIERLKAPPPVFPPFPPFLAARKMWDQVQDNAKAATEEIERLKKIADDATTAAQYANNRAALAGTDLEALRSALKSAGVEITRVHDETIIALPSRPTHVYELSEKHASSPTLWARVGIYTSLEAAKNGVRMLVHPSVIDAICWLDSGDTSIAAGTQGQMFSILRTKLS
jgi:hypothetical protein